MTDLEKAWAPRDPNEPEMNFYVSSMQSDMIITSAHGRIVTRRGTGGNVEITHFKVDDPRKGHGKWLFKAMLTIWKNNPPYHTVYGFTRAVNFDAHKAYEALGFTLSSVSGVYADGEAVVFSATYADLCARHLKE